MIAAHAIWLNLNTAAVTIEATKWRYNCAFVLKATTLNSMQIKVKCSKITKNSYSMPKSNHEFIRSVNLWESFTFDKFICLCHLFKCVGSAKCDVFLSGSNFGFLIQFWLIIKPCKIADLFICSMPPQYYLSQERFNPFDCRNRTIPCNLSLCALVLQW